MEKKEGRGSVGWEVNLVLSMLNLECLCNRLWVGGPGTQQRAQGSLGSSNGS